MYPFTFTATTTTTNPGSLSNIAFTSSSRGWVTSRQAGLEIVAQESLLHQEVSSCTTTQLWCSERSIPLRDGRMLPNSAKHTYSVSCKYTLGRQYLILYPKGGVLFCHHLQVTTKSSPVSTAVRTRLPVARRRGITWLCQDYVLEPLRTLYHSLLSVEGWPRQFRRDDGPLNERSCRTALVGYQNNCPLMLRLQK